MFVFGRRLAFPLASLLALSLWVAPVLAQISDTTPITITSISFDTTSIDVSAGPQQVTLTFQATDDLSGVQYIYGQFDHFSGQTVPFYGYLIAGNALNGTYEAVAYFPQSSAQGTWSISLQTSDSAGNTSFLDSFTLQSLGFPTNVEVISVGEDVSPPTVTGVSFSPTSVNVSAGTVPATVALTLTDDITGVALGNAAVQTDFALVLLSPPPALQRITLSSQEFTLVSGSPQSGVWEATVDVPRYSAPGIWEIESLAIRDAVNNRIQLDKNMLTDLGIVANLTVMDSIPDLTAPALTNFLISPASVDTSTGPRVLTASVSATDNLAGVDWSPTTPNIAYILFYVNSPSGQQFVYHSPFQEPARTAGTPLNGTWQLPFTLPQYAEAGTWKVSLLTLRDAANNQVTFNADALTARGFQPRFVVTRPTSDTDGAVGPAGGTVTDESFGARASVTFPPGVASATTQVAIDVFPDPLELPDPRGFSGVATYFVNIAFDPRLPSPLPAPGITVVLPLRNVLPPGTPLSLYHLDPVTGQLAPARNHLRMVVVGVVNADGLSATFANVVTLSTVAAYIPNGALLGDVNGDNTVDCADLAMIRAAYGARKGQPRYNALADINNDNVVDIKDLAVVSKQMPPKTSCR